MAWYHCIEMVNDHFGIKIIHMRRFYFKSTEKVLGFRYEVLVRAIWNYVELYTGQTRVINIPGENMFQFRIMQHRTP